MILVMAGTTEGLELAKRVKIKKIPLVACVVTEYGGDLLAREGIDVIIGAQDVNGLIGIINDYKIKCLVDCTHPYAQQGSINAIEACKTTNIPFLRYQRREGNSEGSTMVSGYPEAISLLNSCQGNIFLTIGSNNLEIFTKELKDPSRIIARVLPTSDVVAKCMELGLQPHQIIAIKGPFSKELNKALIKHNDCKILVTKDSGETGGFDTKLEAAKDLGVPSLVITRPQINYPKQSNDLDEIIELLSNYK